MISSTGLPTETAEVWGQIASNLTPTALNCFKLACKKFHSIGQIPAIKRPIYQRMYQSLKKLDISQSLPSTLPTVNFEDAYKSAYDEIEKRLKQEISYIEKNHPGLVYQYFAAKDCSGLTPLQILEKVSDKLDDLNSDIIKSKINLDIPLLSLQGTFITRIPTKLINHPEYKNYFENLRFLNCTDNQVQSLNFQGMTALEVFSCPKNKLTDLQNLQDLVALRDLNCEYNQLLSLDLQNMTSLIYVNCSNNQLSTLEVQGLTRLEQLNCSCNQLAAINLQGLTALKELYADYNNLTSFDPETIDRLGEDWIGWTLYTQNKSAASTLNDSQPTSLKQRRTP
jgi:Leucine-rich repeat (LRR) protein